jgi:hypothetical protein
VDTNNFALAYLGVPGQQGTTIGSAFPAVNGGARWQLKYDVGGDTAQIRIRNFSGSGSWETVASAGLTSVHGAGNSAACTDTADNTGDYVIVRIPRATLATATVIPKQIAIAEGINIGIPAQPDNADAAGWPFTTAVFDAPAAIFDFTIWQPPTGAAGCDTSGIDGTPVCQFAP